MSTTAVAPPRNWPLRLTYAAAAGTLLLVVGSPLGVRSHAVWDAERRLGAAIADADRLDPGRRIEELEAKRAVVPDEENSALVIKRLGPLFPRDWMEPRQLPNGDVRLIEYEFSEAPLGYVLSDDLRKELRDELAKAGGALPEAHRLLHLPQGRFAWSIRDMSVGNVDDFQAARRVARFLSLDSQLESMNGAIDEPLLRSVAVLNAGRSVGDAPSAVSALVRLAVTALSVSTAERVLSFEEATPQTLLRLEAAFRAERREEILIGMLRAMRAEMFHQMSGPVSKETIEAFERLVWISRPGSVTQEESERGAKWRHLLCPDRALIEGNLARFLERANRAVELGKLTEDQHHWKFTQFAEEGQLLELNSGSEARLLAFAKVLGAQEKLATATLKANTMLDCAILGLAAERFRLHHGRWPKSLEELVPDFVEAIPVDLFSGSKLLYRRRPDGIVIYSVGYNQIDDQGLLPGEDDIGLSNKDFGFRLLDPQHRRKLPLPPKDDPGAPPPPLPPPDEGAP